MTLFLTTPTKKQQALLSSIVRDESVGIDFASSSSSSSNNVYKAAMATTKLGDGRAEFKRKLLEDADTEINSRIKSMRNTHSLQRDWIGKRLALEIDKHPKDVLNLTLREFIVDYNGDIATFLQVQARRKQEDLERVNETLRRSKRKGAGVAVPPTPSSFAAGTWPAPLPASQSSLMTPAGASRTLNPAFSGLMTPRAGGRQNNASAVMFTPARTRGRRGAATDAEPAAEDEQPTIAVPLANGNVVEIGSNTSAAELAQLPKEAAEEVKDQLEAMSRALQLVLEKLNKAPASK